MTTVERIVASEEVGKQIVGPDRGSRVDRRDEIHRLLSDGHSTAGRAQPTGRLDIRNVVRRGKR